MASADKVVLLAENEWQRRRIAELETWQQKMMARKPTKGFYRGVIAALAVVYSADQETLFNEIVDSVGEKELLEVATDEDMGWMKDYGYARKGKIKATFELEDVV